MKNITKYAATALITGIILTSGSAHATSLKPVGSSGSSDICKVLQAKLNEMLEAHGEFMITYGTPLGGEEPSDTFDVIVLPPELESLSEQLWAVMSGFYYDAYSLYGCKLDGIVPEHWEGPSPERPHWPN